MAAEEDGLFSRWFKRWSKKDEPAPLPKPEPKQRVLTTVEIESAAKTKREWLDKQMQDSERQLMAWPTHLIEGFYVVGLPPDTEVTQIAYDLLGQKSYKEIDGRTQSGALTPPLGMPAHSATVSAAQSTQPSANGAVTLKPAAGQGHGNSWDGQRTQSAQQVQHLQFRFDPAVASSHSTPFLANPAEPSWHTARPASSTATSAPESHEHERVRSDLSLQVPQPFLYSQPYMAADTGSPAAGTAFHDASQAFAGWPERAPSNASLRSSRPQLVTYDKPPAPSYPASVLFRYPSTAQSTLSDGEIANLCFPHQVAPRRLRRSPSWSALYSVINHKPLITPGTAYIFMAKKVMGLPVYGICYTVDEPIHRPPTLAQACWPACAAPYRQCLITAPRCYCITSNYPFFDLLCQALNTIVGLERLNRSLAFTAELQTLVHSPSPTLRSGSHTPHYLAASSQFGGVGLRDADKQDERQQGKDLIMDLSRASTGTPRHIPGPGLRVSLHRLSHDSGLASSTVPALSRPPAVALPSTQQPAYQPQAGSLQHGSQVQSGAQAPASVQTDAPFYTLTELSSLNSSNSIHQASSSLSYTQPVTLAGGLQPVGDVQPLDRSSDSSVSSTDQDDVAALSILGSDLVPSASASPTVPVPPAAQTEPAFQGGLTRTLQISRPGITHNASVFAHSADIAAAAVAPDAGSANGSSRQNSNGSQPVESQQEISFGGAWRRPNSMRGTTEPGSLASFHTAADADDDSHAGEVEGSQARTPARGMSQASSVTSTPHFATPSRLSRVGVSKDGVRAPQQVLASMQDNGKDLVEEDELETRDGEGSLQGASSPTCQGLPPLFQLSPAMPSLVVAPGTPLAQAPLPMQTSRASNSLSLSSNGQLTAHEQLLHGTQFSAAEPYASTADSHTTVPGLEGGLHLGSHTHVARAASGLRFQQDRVSPPPAPHTGSTQLMALRPQLSGAALSSRQPSMEPSTQTGAVDTNMFSPLSVVDSLLTVPVPTPGDQLQVPLPHLPPLTHQRCLLPKRWPVLAPPAALAAYADDELAAELAPWAAALLARSLSLDALLTLLNAALLERPIVVFHPDAALLTSCVLGVLPLLRPFTWQCTVLPTLSEKDLLIILKAPVPFLVGCQYKTPEISAECAGLVRVNLYKGSISNVAGMPALPGGKRLAAALAPHHARLRQCCNARASDRAVPGPVTEEQAQAATALLTELHAYMTGSLHASAQGLNRSTSLADSLQPANSLGPHGLAPAGRANGSSIAEAIPAQQHNTSSWWSSLVGGSKTSQRTASQASGPSAAHAGSALQPAEGTWGGIVGELRPHIITHVGPNGERTATLFKESLLEAQPARDRPWVRAFLDTQIFQVYCDHVMAATCESRGRSDS